MSFKTFFRLWTSREKNEWNTLGTVLAIGFTLGTMMYMSFAVTSQHGVINGQFWKLLPLVLLFGAMMAGLMGWLLASSMLETKALGCALFIHFLQDMVIFGGGAMIIAGTQS